MVSLPRMDRRPAADSPRVASRAEAARGSGRTGSERHGGRALGCRGRCVRPRPGGGRTARGMDPRSAAVSSDDVRARADATGVRAAIARAWLGASTDVPEPMAIALGAITLRPHQAAGVARLRAALAAYGGALLADETGLGKTHMAVALIAEAKQPLIVAPAALLAMWRSALSETGVAARMHTIEALSHGRLPSSGDLVVVDEAHHFRNPKTRRYAALAELVTQTNVLLLSATPVHNQSADITALLALFRANPPLGRVIIRREHTNATRP